MKLSILSVAVLSVLSVSVMNGVAHAERVTPEWNSDTSGGSMISYILPDYVQRYNDAVTDWNNNHVNWTRVTDALADLKDATAQASNLAGYGSWYNGVTELPTGSLPVPAKDITDQFNSNGHITTGGSVAAQVAPVVEPNGGHESQAVTNFWADPANHKIEQDYQDAIQGWKEAHTPQTYQAIMTAKAAYDAYFPEALAHDPSRIRVDNAVIPTLRDPSLDNAHAVNPDAVAQYKEDAAPVYHGDTQRSGYTVTNNPHAVNEDMKAQVTNVVVAPDHMKTYESSPVSIQKTPTELTQKAPEVLSMDASQVNEKAAHAARFASMSVPVPEVQKTPEIVQRVPVMTQKTPVEPNVAPVQAVPVVTQKIPEVPVVTPVAQSVPVVTQKVPARPEAVAMTTIQTAPVSTQKTPVRPEAVPMATIQATPKETQATPVRGIHETATAHTVKVLSLTPAKAPVTAKPTTKATPHITATARPVTLAATKHTQTQAAPVHHVATPVSSYQAAPTVDSVTHEELNKQNHKLSAGIAGVYAFAGIPQVQGKKVSIGAGVGNYEGEQALSVGAVVSVTDNVTAKVGFSIDSQDNVGEAAGVSVGF